MNDSPTVARAPYIVFNDLPLSMTKLQKIADLQGFDADFVSRIGSRIQETLLSYFPDVRLIESDVIQAHLTTFARNSHVPVLSMTPLLAGNDKITEFPFSRFCSLPENGNVSDYLYLGLLPRYGIALTYQENLDYLKKRYKGQSISIVDDVVFSGRSMLTLIEELTRGGVHIDSICACVILGDAYKLLSQQGINIIFQHKFDSVIDVVCTRDFIFGAPDGGMNFLKDDGSITFCTYAIPFGDVKKWASIDDKHAHHFSYSMLKLSHEFWTMMEKYNNRTISTANLLKGPLIWDVGTSNIAAGLLSIMDTFTQDQKICVASEHNKHEYKQYADGDDASGRKTGLRGY